MERHWVVPNLRFRRRSVNYPAVGANGANELVLLGDNPSEKMVEVSVRLLETQCKDLLLLAPLAVLMLCQVEGQHTLAPSPKNHLSPSKYP